jgi:hypothetical protein
MRSHPSLRVPRMSKEGDHRPAPAPNESRAICIWLVRLLARGRVIGNQFLPPGVFLDRRVHLDPAACTLGGGRGRRASHARPTVGIHKK